VAVGYVFGWPWIAGFDRDWSWRWEIDPAHQWTITIGFGHVVWGLNTIQVDHAGHVELHEFRPLGDEPEDHRQGWFSKRGTLGREGVQRLLAAIDECGVMSWHRRYVTRGIFSEGRQAVWVRQGTREKYVYFEKAWPEPMKRLLAVAQEVTDGRASPLRQVEWIAVPPEVAGTHDDELRQRDRR
jgi:hypothetical protein